MKQTMVKWLAPVVATGMLAATLLWGSRADATVMVEIPLEDMARDAVAIVHGRVVRSGGHLSLDDGQPYTLSTLRVHEWLKGSGDDTIVIREIGGSYGPVDLSFHIDGVPEYRVGEDVIVFLDEDQGGDFFRTYNMVQGKFVVDPAIPGMPHQVRRDAEAVAFARWSNGQMVIAHGGTTTMSLATFRDVILQALALTPPRIPTTGNEEVGR